MTDRLRKKETDASRGVRNVEMHERDRSEQMESESCKDRLYRVAKNSTGKEWRAERRK